MFNQYKIEEAKGQKTFYKMITNEINTSSGNKTKAERIRMQAWFASGVNQSSIDRFLDNGQVVEFTDPIFTSANVEFSINNNENQKMWFSQFDVVIVRISDKGELLGFELPLFPVNGGKKQFLKMDAYEFAKTVKNKKNRVNSFQSIILNRKSETARQKCFTNLGQYAKYVEECIQNDRIGDLGDIIKYANTYSFVEI